MHRAEQHSDFVRAWPEHTFEAMHATDLGHFNRQLRFANTTFTFVGLDARLCEAFDHHYAGLRSKDFEDATEATRHVTLRYCKTDDVFVAPQTAGWQYDLQLSFDPERAVMTGMHYLVSWDRAELQATVFVGPRLSDPIDVLENPFRLVCAYRLLGLGGVMLHSAGFALGGRAAICWGRSGAGKSTLSGLVREAGLEVLSDELNALVPSRDGFFAQAMPFAGDLGRSGAPLQTYEVAGLYTLRQSETPSLCALSRATAVGTMSAAAPFINTDPYVEKELFDVLGQLLTGYQAHTLAFPKSAEAPRFVRKAIFEQQP